MFRRVLPAVILVEPACGSSSVRLRDSCRTIAGGVQYFSMIETTYRARRLPPPGFASKRCLEPYL